MIKSTLWSAMKLPNSEQYILAFQGPLFNYNDLIGPNKNFTNKFCIVSEPRIIEKGFIVAAIPLDKIDDITLNTGTQYACVDEIVGEYEKNTTKEG